ncbi:probable jasmonic acid carboxyl methyltransferase 2 [Trifolium pratense]|uniref:probable jasmonic acid carboxyl methyltransferase 2 n=1 Tax=Trifolium pratense TaxID=57577 RepID=UPI001E691116|nr:probable jasmonic acid carboxyl methyltransferase 2 [Trifolium pratense]
METVVEVLRMNKGAGKTSYAMNSSVQRKVISSTKQAVEKAIKEILCSQRGPIMKMGIADLGCSSGPNALMVISEIVEAINATSSLLNHPAPKELMFYMNDLFTNDFNNIFASLPSFHKKIRQEKENNQSKNNNYNNNNNNIRNFGSTCFVSAVPGTFYGRLFPTKSINFFHSSSSLTWLSRVPNGLKDESERRLNKGKLYISKSTPNYVMEAYSQQFQNDFSCFLESRSLELIDGGRMVLTFMGRESMDPAAPYGGYHWELLAQALMTMVSEGLVEEEKVDSFNAPYYACCYEELKMVIEKEGSFSVDSFETYEIDWDEGIESEKGEGFARLIRAGYESLLEYHFGSHILDDLFGRYAQLVDHHFSKTKPKFLAFNISLVK